MPKKVTELSPREESDPNWKFCALACGSNAFNQSNLEQSELMSSVLKEILVGAKSKQHAITSIGCGSNLTAVCSANSMDDDSETNMYVWGEGLPSGQLRVPTLFSVRNVREIACGQGHVALVTNDGKAFSFGSGDQGMLGHGNKQNVASPKQIMSLASLACLQVSCGAFHTAIIASPSSEVVRINVPAPPCLHQDPTVESTPVSRFRDRNVDDMAVMECGQLYMCGVNKAGQLGLGNSCGAGGGGSRASVSNNNIIATPTLVRHLQSEGVNVGRVSCGMHHTLVIGVPVGAMRTFTTCVYSCGWGEHGRLGLGDEEGRFTPQLVSFPMPLHATEIAAGEQHSLAAGKQGCYAWGNNAMGQLGVASPATTEFALSPVLVPLPEHMLVKKLAAGGRHSAAITHCGKLLTWGWGEEGQLGHGTEKSSYLARPCRVPRVAGVAGRVLQVSLGMTHSLVVVENQGYVAKPRVEPAPRIASPVAVVVEERPVTPAPPSPVVLPVAPSPPKEEELVIERAVVKSVKLMEDDDWIEAEVSVPVPVPVPTINHISSIKELLQLSEQRMLQRIADEEEEAEAVVEQPPPVPSPAHSPLPPVVAEEEVVEVAEVPPSVVEQAQEQEILEEAAEEGEEEEDQQARAAAPAAAVVEDKYRIYYKDGQDTKNCLIANTAKRAEQRRQRKLLEAQQAATSTANNTNNSLIANRRTPLIIVKKAVK